MELEEERRKKIDEMNESKFKKFSSGTYMILKGSDNKILT
jgi:hypothetical protein